MEGREQSLLPAENTSKCVLVCVSKRAGALFIYPGEVAKLEVFANRAQFAYLEECREGLRERQVKAMAALGTTCMRVAGGTLSMFGLEDLQSPCWDAVSGSLFTLTITEIPQPWRVDMLSLCPVFPPAGLSGC